LGLGFRLKIKLKGLKIFTLNMFFKIKVIRFKVLGLYGYKVFYLGLKFMFKVLDLSLGLGFKFFN